MSFIVPEDKWLVYPGQRFSQLTVAGVPFYSLEGTRRKQHVVVRCDCGVHFLIRPRSVKKQIACNSCGHKSHGMSATGVWQAWRSMRQRCEDSSCGNYPRYGGRGIRVCDEWSSSFEAFRDWALSNGHRDDLSLDRINNDGNYEPKNCRWTNWTVQANNRSTTTKLTIYGETKALADWANDNRCAVSAGTLRLRLHYGWSNELALTAPLGSRVRKRPPRRLLSAFGETKSVTDWSVDDRCTVSFGTLLHRVSDGWSDEDAIARPLRATSRSCGGETAPE